MEYVQGVDVGTGTGVVDVKVGGVPGYCCEAWLKSG